MGLQPRKIFRRAVTWVAAATLFFNGLAIAPPALLPGSNVVLAEGVSQDTQPQNNSQQVAVQSNTGQPDAETGRPDTVVEQPAVVAGQPGAGPVETGPGQPQGKPSNSGQIVHKVRPGQTLFAIAAQYGASVEAIAAANGLANPNKIKAGQLLLIPTGAVLERIQLASRSLGLRGRAGIAFIRPLQARISSDFGIRWGRMHYGIDFAAPVGTPIAAAADGEVVYSGWRSGYGRLIILDHGNGVQTYYAHNSERLVSAGARVSQGQIIARVGTSGSTTGPNLHFEVRINGEAVDPLPFLR
ncbi:MAG: peptidoglycan DD-metalloendopeptidase family protein [Syntrophothermus sp.]